MKIEGGERKALEVLLYIANRTSNMYNVLKAIYIADKLHLARYGRLIYPESFIAMDYGPVPSLAYDLVKDVRECRDRPIHDGVFEAFGMQGNSIRPRRQADTDLLSESDIECLDAAIAESGHLSFGDLKRMTHTDPAYACRGRNEAMSLRDIAEGLGVPGLVDYLEQEGYA